MKPLEELLSAQDQNTVQRILAAFAAAVVAAAVTQGISLRFLRHAA
jgi:hypothetical protein